MSKDTFQFQSQHAVQWGLHAALVYDYVQSQLQQTEQPMMGSLAQWQSWLPFLSQQDIQQALETLVASGVLARLPSDPVDWQVIHQQKHSVAGYDEPPPPAPNPQLLTANITYIESSQASARYSDQPLYDRFSVEEPTPASGQRALMLLDWQPSADCIEMIAQRGITAEFALAQRGNFVLYYRDSGQRNLSWDTKFLNWVSRCWQYHLNDTKHEHGLSTGQSMATTRGNRESVRAKLRDIGDTNW